MTEINHQAATAFLEQFGTGFDGRNPGLMDQNPNGRPKTRQKGASREGKGGLARMTSGRSHTTGTRRFGT